MLKINVPNFSWSEQAVTLDGKQYRFVFRFNERDQRWRLDIYLGSTPVILGVKILENVFLLGEYYPEGFQHGDLFCGRLREDNNPVGRTNLGFGKPFELVYYTRAELRDI